MMKIPSLLSAVALMTTLAALPENAVAEFAVYTNRSAWELAVLNSTTFDFNHITQDHNLGTSGSFDAGPFTLSAAGPFASDNGIEAYDPRPTDIQSLGQNRNIDGTTYFSGDTDEGTVITIDFHSPITAFGLDYTNMNGGSVWDSIQIGEFTFNFPSSTGFIGIVELSFNEFNTLTIQGDDGAWGVDNFSYSTLPNIVTTFAPVPEPATIAIWGVALVSGYGLQLRHRKNGVRSQSEC